MRQRRPQIGDMLVVTPRVARHHSPEKEYIGIVREIRLDRWGHQENVFVQWSEDAPPNYNLAHGYAGTNIHNLRSEFEVIRNGVSIP